MRSFSIAPAVFLFFASVAPGQQQAPEYLYVSGNSTAGFAINRITGALTAVPGSPFGPYADTVAAAPRGHFVFTGRAGISSGVIDRATGSLSAVPGSPFDSGWLISLLAVTPDEHYLFAAVANKIYSFSVDGVVGAITQTAPPVTLSAAVSFLVISPTSKFLYAGGGYASVLGFAINPQTGVLTQLASTGSGKSAVISADGKYLYSSLLLASGKGLIFGYSINGQSGALTALPGSPFSAAPQGVSLAIDPTGRFVYETVYDPLQHTIGVAGFLINSSTGAIEASLPGSPFPVTTGFPVGIAIDHSARFLYAADDSPAAISEFAINGMTGSLAALPGTPPAISVGPPNLVVIAPPPPSTATLTALNLGPADPMVDINATSAEQFVVTGTYSDGTHRFLTASVTWGSSNPSVATISNTPGASGLATILSQGQTVIEAALNGVTATTTLSVNQSALVSVAVSPANPSVATGTAIQFTATGKYTDGTSKDITQSVAWKSTRTSVATVNQSGLADGLSVGTATIEAGSGSVAGLTVLTVTSR